jgi:hypothetical protein
MHNDDTRYDEYGDEDPQGAYDANGNRIPESPVEPPAEKTKEDIAKDYLSEMFGFQPTEEVAGEGQATLQYSDRKVVIDPSEYVNVAQAFSENADDLSLPSGNVSYSLNGDDVASAAPVEAGGFYIATTRHDGKGA